MEKLLTVIVPVYNTADYLPRCVDSLLNQGLGEQLEILLVNDGSTDGSEKICDKYYAAYPTIIRLLEKDNGGVSSARNLGMDNASGRYLTFVDSDDYISAGGGYARLIKRYLCEDLDLLQFWHLIPGQPQISSIEKSEIIFDGWTRQSMIQSFNPMIWMRLYRRSYIEKYHLRFNEDQIVTEDTLFSLRLFMTNARIRIVNYPLYFYDTREGSVMNRRRTDTYSRRCIASIMPLLEVFSEYIKKESDSQMRVCLLNSARINIQAVFSHILSSTYSSSEVSHLCQRLKAWNLLPKRFSKINRDNFLLIIGHSPYLIAFYRKLYMMRR